MINFITLSKLEPYNKFYQYYLNAVKKNEINPHAACISSWNASEKIISSRYVNIKKIVEDKFYFYTNYNSPKSKDFDSHNQIACLFYWGTINVQIRISAEIFKSSAKDSDDHFKSRSIEKNALATSSNQSETINSYEQVNKNYLNILNKMKSEPKYKRPLTWGGYYFRPNKFEIWIGNKNRINYREQFLLTDNEWKQEILQP